MTNENTFSESRLSLDTLKFVIILEWEKLVRDAMKSSNSEPSILLQDHIPELLDQLSHILRTGVWDDREVKKNHRYLTSPMTNFTVADILTEYSLLREILITYLYPLGEIDCAKVIHRFLDALMRNAVTEFLTETEVSEMKNHPMIHSLS